MILSLFLRVNGAHHENAGSSEMPLATKNPANSTGLESFRILRGAQVVVLFFHWMRNFHPIVICLRFLTPLLVVMKELDLDTSELYNL